ncbi:MFS transporter [Streptomyces sp. NPDC051940]|uniref:MFS transporter n=1 Tax=Streptomyces sp. NPDC051940 TaxID=3155675 RepID=UPI00343214BA
MYALLFADAGLDIGRLSSLFVLWSVTGLLLEVPAGAFADAVSRRLPLVIGPLLTAAGFALWVLAPGYWSFAAGFVLWGAKGALASGALEALVHDELARLGRAGAYARTMGRARAAGLLGVMAGTGLAGPVLGAGGYAAVGAASVAACLLTAAVAGRFPAVRNGGDGDDEPPLRSAFAELRRSSRVRGAVLLIPAVAAVWGALDEYTPLLARETGAADTAVPWLLLVVWAGATAGGLLGGRWSERLPGGRRLAWLLGGCGAALALGAWVRHPAGMVLVGVAFCGFQLAGVVADARLQERITGPARATLTSFAGLATDLATIGVYGGYALAAAPTSHATAFAVLALPYVVASALAPVLRRAWTSP